VHQPSALPPAPAGSEAESETEAVANIGCDQTGWPDRTQTCGQCKALVNFIVDKYHGKCDTYCASIGKQCVGAAEEDSNTCIILYNWDCSVSFEGTSDAICECSPDFKIGVSFGL
jgi:hypothetical protein